MKTKHIVDGVQPSEGAIHPKNRDELSIALSDVLDSDKVVVPIGGATRLQIGAKIPKYDYALDLSGICLLYTSDAADE